MKNNLQGLILGGATGLVGGLIGGGIGLLLGFGPILTGILAAGLALSSDWALKKFFL